MDTHALSRLKSALRSCGRAARCYRQHAADRTIALEMNWLKSKARLSLRQAGAGGQASGMQARLKAQVRQRAAFRCEYCHFCVPVPRTPGVWDIRPARRLSMEPALKARSVSAQGNTLGKPASIGPCALQGRRSPFPQVSKIALDERCLWDRSNSSRPCRAGSDCATVFPGRLPWADVPARRWRAKCPNLSRSFSAAAAQPIAPTDD
jgi:hypothetical protein